jgi:aspartate 1-decarboxylase
VIAAWSTVDRTELPTVRARIVAVDAANRIVRTLEVPVAGSEDLPVVP